VSSSTELFAYFAQRFGTFVETGTWQGGGIQAALNAGFRHIASCDINEDLVLQARARFRGEAVEVFHGSSEEFLGRLIPKLTEPTVFFLDAHAMPPSAKAKEFSPLTLKPGDEANPTLQCPLQEEVQLILQHEFMGHVILVDDVQCFGTWMFHYLSESQLKNQVHMMCPGKYAFHYYQNVLCIVPKGVGSPREPFVKSAIWAIGRLRRNLFR
jgi:hypothetical protein